MTAPLSRETVKLADFGIQHIPDARRVRVVRERDGEGFDVCRLGAPGRKHIRAYSYYLVENKTHLKDGKIALTLREVRTTIRNA